MTSTSIAPEPNVDEALEAYWASQVSETALPFVSREFNDSILPSLKVIAERDAYTADQYKSMWMWAWSITHRLFDALHPYALNEKEKARYFWCHQHFDVFHLQDRSRGIEITKDSLLSVAATYLGHPEIRTNRFDWLLLDAIVFQELEAYGEHVFSTKAGTGMNWAAVFAQGSQAKYYGFQLLFSLIGFAVNALALPLIAYYLALRDHPNWAIATTAAWVISVALQVISYPARRRARRKAAALLQHLIDLYNILGSNTVSPRKLRETLDAAAAAGVVLDGAVFTIVDRLIARDPTAFIPTSVG
jgi:hypothetical protein